MQPIQTNQVAILMGLMVYGDMHLIYTFGAFVLVKAILGGLYA